MDDMVRDPIARDDPWSRRKQLLGLGMVSAGIAGLVVVGFVVASTLGFAVLSAGVVGVGLLLGRD